MPEYPAAALTVASATHAIAKSGVSEDATGRLGSTPNTSASIGLAPDSSYLLRPSHNTNLVANAAHADMADTHHAYLITSKETRRIVPLVDADNSGTAESDDAEIFCLLPIVICSIAWFKSVKISTEPDLILSVDSDHAGAKSHAL
jgi:hypothetical protein